MRFRRIYWVTEQVDEQGLSEVTGVFTSIPDLIETGLGVRPVSEKAASFRVTLCELDCSDKPLLSFQSPNFDAVPGQVKPLLDSGEVSHEEYLRLVDALRSSLER